MPPSAPFWSWWASSGIGVWAIAFFWYMSPLGLGFRTWSTGVDGQIAHGIYRFSYFILNPSMVLAWLTLPLFYWRGVAGFGWRLLGLIVLLLGGCIGAIFAIV